MRADSPHQFPTIDSLSGVPSAAKSLFRNILDLSPCESIFCADPAPSLPSNGNN